MSDKRSFLEKITDKLNEAEGSMQKSLLIYALIILSKLQKDIECDSISMTFDGKTLCFTAHKRDKSKSRSVSLGELESIIDMSIIYKSVITTLRE